MLLCAHLKTALSWWTLALVVELRLAVVYASELHIFALVFDSALESVYHQLLFGLPPTSLVGMKECSSLRILFIEVTYGRHSVYHPIHRGCFIVLDFVPHPFYSDQVMLREVLYHPVLYSVFYWPLLLPTFICGVGATDTDFILEGNLCKWSFMAFLLFRCVALRHSVCDLVYPPVLLHFAGGRVAPRACVPTLPPLLL